MCVAIAYWLSKNNFESKKTELSQLIGGVSQSLKVDHGLVGGYWFLYLRLIIQNSALT
jgi:hypothetical protein